jgi:hypothetical protein
MKSESIMYNTIIPKWIWFSRYDNYHMIEKMNKTKVYGISDKTFDNWKEVINADINNVYNGGLLISVDTHIEKNTKVGVFIKNS